MKKILITGMSGLIGGLLRNYLEELGGYELTALNRRPVQGVRCFEANIMDLESIKAAFDGQDVVVHLAANLDLENWEEQLTSNIIGTYNVYEAARSAGIKRVVFASSGSVIRGKDNLPPYDSIVSGNYGKVSENWPMVTHEVTHPQGIYGAAKVWGEAIGHRFSDLYGMSVLCVRLGHVTRRNRPVNPRERSVYLSHRDVVDIFHKCIEAPDELTYDIFFATSDNKWGYRDLEHPRQILGFVPQDSADLFE